MASEHGRKWQNSDAGPRQVSDLNKAIRALHSEGITHDQITGVIGGAEDRRSYMSLMSPPRPEVAELDEAIRARYGYTITRGNVRQIIADYEAALPKARESRPVKDERRTPEEDAEIKATAAERDARHQAERDAENTLLSQVMAKAPAAAKALIVAEYQEDTSNPQADYSGSRVARTAAIGWRFSAREDFRALRAAAAQFPETKHMASEEALLAWLGRPPGAHVKLEHRDNYSMGSGNYLSDHGTASSGTGWVIKSAAFPCKWVHLTEDAIPDAPAAPAPASGTSEVTISRSSLGRPGVIEVRFADKPGADVIEGMHRHGFRWARRNRCWYGTDTAYAETLVTQAGVPASAAPGQQGALNEDRHLTRDY